MLKRSLAMLLIVSMVMSLFAVAPTVTKAEETLEPSTGPFGPNVYVFDPTTPPQEIQRITTEVFKRQEKSEFGNDRYAFLFKPGTYDANIRVGFYTHVAGLGQMPDDVVINGGVTVDAEWWPPNNATKNFWRGAENFAINPASGMNKWAVSQAVFFRRMHVMGSLQLHDGGWASGGYLADSKIDQSVGAGGQQQWFSRNNSWTSWSGGVWNTVFLGIDNPPADNWPTNTNTVIDKTPLVREKPFLTIDPNGNYQVFVPALRNNVKGNSWSGGTSTGRSIPLDQFYVARPETSDAASINAALAQGKNLLFTPGIYHLNDTIRVTRPDTVVLGIGFATLVPHHGVVALSVADVDGVTVAGLLFDAGSESSPVLVEVGPAGSSNDHSANPTLLQDLFFRVGGGPQVGRADTSITINSNHVIGDHFWVWRADHGQDVAWHLNTTTNGLVVNGDDVTIYGLFVEHYHEYQTLWNGDRGRMYFYQSEIPYDVPDQESWMSSNGTVNGFASYKVAESVKTHDAWGLGIYSFFRDADVKLESAIEIPDTPGVRIHHATSVYLSGFGEVTHIVNNKGTTVKKSNMRATFTEYTPRTPSSIEPVAAATITGKAPLLPAGVTQVYTDASTKHVPVTWEAVHSSTYTSPGSFTVKGAVGASTIEAVAQITVAQAPNVAVTGIQVTGAGHASAITEKQGTLQMSAAVVPSHADQTAVTWSVVNTNGKETDKATINAAGLLKAANDGVVKVVATATDGTGIKGEALITISGQIIRVHSITVSGAGGSAIVATKGGTLQMSAVVEPATANERAVTWSVVNGTGKATIDAAGLVKAQGDGMVDIIATSKDGSGVIGKQTITIVGQALMLNGGWSWVRENTGNWAIDPASAHMMRLTTIEGSWGGSKPSNILLRDPGTTGDMTITTKLNFDAAMSFEWAGLIMYQDDGNGITLGRQANGTNPGAAKQIRFSQIKNGTQTDKNYVDPVAPNDIYLKIEKKGNVYKGYYSVDGLTWSQVTDTFTTTLTNPKVGIFVRKLNTSIPVKVAEFTNFTLNDTVIPFWNPVTSLSVTGAGGSSEIKADKGTLQMLAAVLPSGADNKAVLWSVVNTDGSATDTATIRTDGRLTAAKNGQVRVVATAIDGSGVTGSATVDISGQIVEVASITVAGAGGATAITSKGGTLQMSADVRPADATDRTVTWSVYNPDGSLTDKARISQAGLLTAFKNGPVRVVAQAVYSSHITGEAFIYISNQDVIVTVPVTGIAVSGADGATAITSKGGQLQMVAAVTPENADHRTVTWSVYQADGTDTDKATISLQGLLTAVKDGQVKVVASAVYGSDVRGYALITISGQVGSDPNPTTTPDSSSSSSPPLATPSQNEHQQLITGPELKQVLDGKATVTLGKGKTEAVLPADVAQTISHPVEVRSDGVSVIIPPAVFKQLTNTLQGHAEQTQVIVRIKPDSNGQSSLQNDYKLNNRSYNLDLLLLDKDGKASQASTLPESVRVVLPYDGARADADLIGIYKYNDKARTWEYVGGMIDAGQKTITSSVPQLGKYAVLEYNKTFADVPSAHWAYRTLKVMAAKHIVNGVSDMEFNPAGPTTRAEFVTMLVKALGLKAAKAHTRFEDVQASDWYASAVAAAYEAGLVSGVSESQFAPDTPMTREQMALLIVRAYEYVHGARFSLDMDQLAVLKDQDQVSAWAATGVNKAIETGLMSGQSTDIFAPRAVAVRAETAQAILNMLNRLQK